MKAIAIFGGIAVWCAFTATAVATSINETVSEDMHIIPRPDIADSNFGSSQRAIVGGTTINGDFQVPLFRWSLESVPAGEVAVTDGILKLSVFSTNFISEFDQFAVYKINPANAGWVQGDGGATDPGEPTWNVLAAPDTPWVGGPGLGDNAGGAGYDPAFATLTYDSTTMATQVEITIPMSILNDWISNPAGNAGILMRQVTMDTTERLLRFNSLESGNQETMPAAVLSFETAPTMSHPGDFNGDGDVDGEDFVAWQSNFPKASGATLADGDADGDGDVDGADFVVWQTNFPFTPGPGAAPIPEPPSWIGLMAAAIALPTLRRARVVR